MLAASATARLCLSYCTSVCIKVIALLSLVAWRHNHCCLFSGVDLYRVFFVDKIDVALGTSFADCTFKPISFQVPVNPHGVAIDGLSLGRNVAAPLSKLCSFLMDALEQSFLCSEKRFCLPFERLLTCRRRDFSEASAGFLSEQPFELLRWFHGLENLKD